MISWLGVEICRPILISVRVMVKCDVIILLDELCELWMFFFIFKVIQYILI